MAPTITLLVKKREHQLSAVAFNESTAPKIIDLPLAAPGLVPVMNSSIFIGTDFHRSLASALRRRAAMPEYAPFSDRLSEWFKEIGVHRTRPEFKVDGPEIRGTCDVLVEGGQYGSFGVVEVKSRNDVQSSPKNSHRLQLYLYLTACRQLGINVTWGALVYCGLKSRATRVFLWSAMWANAEAVGAAIREAA